MQWENRRVQSKAAERRQSQTKRRTIWTRNIKPLEEPSKLPRKSAINPLLFARGTNVLCDTLEGIRVVPHGGRLRVKVSEKRKKGNH